MKLQKAKAVRDGMVLHPYPLPLHPRMGIRDPCIFRRDAGCRGDELFPALGIRMGKYRITYTVDKPKPITEYTKLLKKFAHLEKADLQSYRLSWISGFTASKP